MLRLLLAPPGHVVEPQADDQVQGRGQAELMKEAKSEVSLVSPKACMFGLNKGNKFEENKTNFAIWAHDNFEVAGVFDGLLTGMLVTGVNPLTSAGKLSTAPQVELLAEIEVASVEVSG